MQLFYVCEMNPDARANISIEVWWERRQENHTAARDVSGKKDISGVAASKPEQPQVVGGGCFPLSEHQRGREAKIFDVAN